MPVITIVVFDLIKCSLKTTGGPDLDSKCISLFPSFNSLHLLAFPFFITPFPYNSTNWWISTGKLFFAVKNLIKESILQLAELVIDIVFYNVTQNTINTLGDLKHSGNVVRTCREFLSTIGWGKIVLTKNKNFVLTLEVVNVQS